ncbi:MAG: glutathione S-transferase N-terminal domain-containing protein [Alphaproteobacteria bacterium]|nr:glutathione S-transferase N-terminal domain-containing protein [Alphaproteobacteria bacterium]
MTWPTSPFGAKVKACLKALDLYDGIEIINYFPWLPDNELRIKNPINKIPVLILDDGSALYDSPVICEYLNDFAKGSLIPSQKKYVVLRIQALCDGILDAAVSARYETHSRPEHLRSKDWYDRQMQGVKAGLEALATESLDMEITLSSLCAAVTVAYLDLRYPDEPMAKIPKPLRNWFENFVGKHPWLTDILPKDILPLPENRLMLEQ